MPHMPQISNIQVPVHNVHDTHVHNGTFITHSPYGLHAAIEPVLAFVSPLLRPQSQRPGVPSVCFSSIFERHQEQSEPQGLVAQTPYSMAGTLTQPSATVRAPPAPSRSWHTMAASVVYNLCFDLLVLYVTIVLSCLLALYTSVHKSVSVLTLGL